MLGALLYLRVTSLKNQLLTRLKRLRQPKYLAGAIAGLAYFYFFFFRHLTSGSKSGTGAKRAAAKQALGGLPANFADTLPLIAGVAALLILAIVIVAWLLPSDRAGLRFTEAETAFLFPAPVTRRALINYKLLSSQFSILFTSLFFTLISNRWDFLGGNALTHALGWWIVLSTINLHYTGAALTIARLVENGVSPLRRRLYVFAVVAVVVGATLAWVWRDVAPPDAEDVAGFAPFTHYLLEILDHGALGALLLPIKFVVGPFLAVDTPAFLIALPPALLVIALQYVWVLRMETSFEEASIALAEKRTALVAAVRSGKRPFATIQTKGRPAPFHLRDTGRPELAFFWKNLLSTAPYFNLRALGIAGAVVIVGSRWFLGADDLARGVRPVVTGLAAFGGLYILLLGPHLARQDLRGDLQNSDILKTYPLRGWQLLLGQLLTPVSILTGLVWLCVLAAALAFRPSAGFAATLTPTVRNILAVGLAAVTPLLCAVQLLVLNGASIIFPAWFQTMRGQGGGAGIELMGQRLIFVFGQFLVVLVTMLPAALSAAALIFLTQWLIGLGSAIVLATTVVIAVLAGEVWCALWWLGERFEHLDVSAELRP